MHLKVDALDIRGASALIMGQMKDLGYPAMEKDAVIDVTSVSKSVITKCMEFYAKMRADGKTSLHIK